MERAGFSAVVAAAAAFCALNGVAAPAGLSVDHMENASNIGPAPAFGWRMDSDRAGASQKAYRIRVREGSADGAVVWDSGEVADGRSVAVRYAGSPIRPMSRYVWSVSVKDEAGAWSDAASEFLTGNFGTGAWDGSKWISAADSKVSDYPSGRDARDVKQEAEDGTSCFVKTVANAKKVNEAWIAVTGLGVFEAYVNGKPVSRKLPDGTIARDFLKPGFTHYEKTRHSFAYDVTHLLKTGAGESNVFSAQVSAGWWRDKIVNFHGKKSAFRAKLVLRYADGTEECVGTDETWLSALAGPVLRAAIFDGEDYDARVGTPWMTGGAPAGFKQSEVNSEFSGAIVPMEGPGISQRDDLAFAPCDMYVWRGVEGASADAFGKVVKIRSHAVGDVAALAPGETLVVDFGQNAAAVPSFEFEAAVGVTLSAKPAEMLNDGNGAKSRGCDGPEGSIYTTNYRKARTTMNYTFAGAGVEKYRPEFTFFGYRYLSLTATGPVKIRSILSVPVTSVPKGSETGSLVTGLPDVNRLIRNVLWGQYSNYVSVPTDCPQRNERLGWTADTQVFSLAATCNADVYGFLSKWMRDMRDSQHDDGSFPGVAPKAQYGDLGHQLGWADAGVIVPYVLWSRYGDRRVVDDNWEAMSRYMRLLESMKYASKESMSHQWADWLSYEKLESRSRAAYLVYTKEHSVPKEEAKAYWRYLGFCYWMWDAQMMSAMAAATGRDAEAAAYRGTESRVRDLLRGEFVEKGTGLLIELFRDMQTPALFALKLGLLDPAPAAKTRDALLANIREHGDCLQTGFLGTSILMDALTDSASAPEVAYTLLLQHKNPSWLYSVDQGATTVWERWNSYTKAAGFGPADMNSFNHYAYGAVLAWMHRTMAGIREDPSEPGFRHFVLAPVPDRRMVFADARFRSPYGEIRSAWRYESGRLVWEFTIPANTTATVIAPGCPAREYVAGTYVVKQ